MVNEYTEHDALKAAVDAAAHSGCRKSQRGVVIFHRRFGLQSFGTNYPPHPFSCDGSKQCRKVCNKICIHAEQHALLKSGAPLRGYEMLHVEVVDGEAVPSGGPSCWQCSRIILAAKLERMWLLHEDGLRSYSAAEFHLLTLKEKNLYVGVFGGADWLAGFPWLKKALAHKDGDGAIDIVYDNLDEMLTAGRFDDVDKLLSYCSQQASSIPSELLLAILTLTSHAPSDCFSSRGLLVNATRTVLRTRGEWEPDALKGLE